jgi:serine/threonine protein kinase
MEFPLLPGVGLSTIVQSSPSLSSPSRIEREQPISTFLSILSLLCRLVNEGEENEFLTFTWALRDADFTSQRPIIGVGHHFVAYESPVTSQDRARRISGAETYCLKIPNLSSGSDHKELYHTILQGLRVLCHPSISKHENIIRLLGFEFIEDYDDYKVAWPVLAMEYAAHGTLTDFLQNGVGLAPDIFRMLLLDAAVGIDMLHRCNIIHGDVKSENVLICHHQTRKYVAKVCDFGLAVINPASDAKCRLPGGTWPWTAPEGREQLTVDGLRGTDIFSFGLMVWRVIVNIPNPFELLKPQMIRGFETSSLEDFISYAKVHDSFVESVIGTIRASRNGKSMMRYASDVVCSTLHKNPTQRDMSKAIFALTAESGRPVLRYVYAS